MERKYQVFVSSTYEDLRVERQEVIQALLELDCIPSGMELFPAANEDQWSLIKTVIEECDYYLLIVAGRYGSLGPDGTSFTEMEYRYALSLGKPTLAFLHKDPASIAKKFTESSVEGQQKLESFRALVGKKMCKHWSSASELGSVVSRSVVNLQRKHPAIGWVRGDVTTDKEASLQIVRLGKQIEDLQQQLAQARTQAPPGTESLAQGDSKMTFGFSATSGKEGVSYSWDDEGVQFSWNEVFYHLSPLMMHEASDHQLRVAFNALLRKRGLAVLRGHKSAKGHRFSQLEFEESDFQTVKVQLRALGLITQSVRARSVKDSTAYWTLTPYGDDTMNRLRAIRSDFSATDFDDLTAESTDSADEDGEEAEDA